MTDRYAALRKAAEELRTDFLHVTRVEIIELLAERDALAAQVEALKVDAERYRWATHFEGNTEILHSIMLCHEGDQDKINARVDEYSGIDAARAGKEG